MGRRAILIYPSGEAVGTDQVVRTVEVKVICRDALERGGRRVRLRTGHLLERGAVLLASRAHGAAVRNVRADAEPKNRY